MMYNSGVAVVVKCNGKILREDKDLVTLPFGSEYSILLKNLESRKCKIHLSIDGQDVLDGNSLILNPNSETELEGFMRNARGVNKFKFIQKTREISEYRGDRIDDGIIRVEFWFEKIIQKQQIVTEYYYPNWFPYDRYSYSWRNESSSKFGAYGGGTSYNGSACGGCNNDVSYSNDSIREKTRSSNFINSSPIPLNDEGITVKGSEINQQFNYTWVGSLEEQSRVIILRLKGITSSGVFIQEPKTVERKITCGICGKKSRSNLKYCSNCGSFLE